MSNSLEGQETPEQPRDLAEEGSSEASPRSFAVGTGLILTLIGTLFILGSCCIWSFSGQVIGWNATPPPTQATPPSMQTGERAEGAFLRNRVAGACTILTFLSGMALLATGVGLYGERPSAAVLAWVVPVALAVLYGSSCVAALVLTGQWGVAILCFFFAVLMVVLSPLAWRSAWLLRRFLPPKQNTIKEEDLAALSKRSHRR